MAAKSQYGGPSDVLDLYDALVEQFPRVERKGAKTPYTSRNGHMFSFLDPTGVFALRLPENARDAFVAQFKTPSVQQHGSVMKEYVAVPKTLLANLAAMKPWFAQSYDYVGTLKPKPTSRGRRR